MKLDLKKPLLSNHGQVHLVTVTPDGNLIWQNTNGGAFSTNDEGRKLKLDGKPSEALVVWNQQRGGLIHGFKVGDKVWTIIHFGVRSTKLRCGVVHGMEGTGKNSRVLVDYGHDERNRSRPDGCYVHAMGTLHANLDSIEKRLIDDLNLVQKTRNLEVNK